MKPDQSVIDAIAAKQAASERTAAIEVITIYLAADPTGLRSFVYKWQVLQEIIAKGNATGHNTIFMTDTNAPNVVPLRQ
jgi:hypothetical protein